ncbi:MAG: glycosyltransferase [Phycisphaerales bacterium]
MRIHHVVYTLDPDGGGPPTYVPRLATAQARLGHDVHIYAEEHVGRGDVIDDFLAHVPGFEPVNVHRFTFASGLQRNMAADMLAGIRSDLQGADIVHLHGVWQPLLARTAKIARRQGVPYVISPHGMLDPYSLNQKALKKRVSMTLIQRRMLNGAAGIHTLNKDESDLIEPLGLRAPLFTVALGLDLDEIIPLPEPGGFRAEHPEIGERPFFLFLSRLHVKKGLDLLAEAAAMYAERGGDWNFVIVGPDGGAKADLEARVASHGLGDRVFITGPAYGDAKRHALADASGFVLPSRQEGFSQAITEAMLCGLPIVCTENCHFPEVADVNAGIVTPLAIEPIADALLAVSSDPDAARAMGENGVRLVTENYAWPKVAAEMVEAYQSHGARETAAV